MKLPYALTQYVINIANFVLRKTWVGLCIKPANTPAIQQYFGPMHCRPYPDKHPSTHTSTHPCIRSIYPSIYSSIHVGESRKQFIYLDQLFANVFRKYYNRVFEQFLHSFHISMPINIVTMNAQQFTFVRIKIRPATWPDSTSLFGDSSAISYSAYLYNIMHA